MTSGIKGFRGFQPNYDKYKILTVLFKTKERKTSIIKKELCKLDEKYCKPTAKWYNENLQALEKGGFVKRIEKEMDKTYYWIITDEGKAYLENLEKNEQEK